jgi:hypothetical protein
MALGLLGVVLGLSAQIRGKHVPSAVILWEWVYVTAPWKMLAYRVVEILWLSTYIVALLCRRKWGWWYAAILTALQISSVFPAWIISPFNYEKPFLWGRTPFAQVYFTTLMFVPCVPQIFWLIKHRSLARDARS